MNPEILTFSIDRLGKKGDGIAETNSGALFVPFTLPGELVTVNVEGDRGELLDVLVPSPKRQSALCHHFGICGGCALQHLKPEFYEDWKRQLIVSAFAAKEIDADVRPLHPIKPGTRRRAVFAARRTKKTVLLGYHASRSHNIVDVDMCAVLVPEIVAALPHLRQLLRFLLSRRGEAKITVVSLPAGLDVLVENTKFEDSPDLRARLAEKAKDAGLARLSIGDDILYLDANPSIELSGVQIDQDPRIFLQAVEESQDFLIQKALSWVEGSRRIADLFSGAGTFTFALAKEAHVAAFENDARVVSILSEAVSKSQNLKPIQVTKRDLFQDPLSALELKEFDAVLFDPPRSGAKEQAIEIAQSSIQKVVAISCNASTLARDARLLVDGGFIMGPVFPVDQFVFSSHVELSVCFERR